MGLQCMYEVFGGKVTFAGEIIHGKVSPIGHDGKGCFKGVPQDVKVCACMRVWTRAFPEISAQRLEFSLEIPDIDGVCVSLRSCCC